MKRATISYTKNNLSRLLGLVREGETILVVDRQEPIARIEPVDPRALHPDERLSVLFEHGLVAAPRQPLDLQQFLAEPTGIPREGTQAVEALLMDREESP